MLCACAPCAAPAAAYVVPAAIHVAAAAPQAGIGCVGASRMLAGDSSSVDAAAALSAAAEAADPFSAASTQTGSSREEAAVGPTAPQGQSLTERLWGEGGGGGGGDAKAALLGMGLILLSQVCVALVWGGGWVCCVAGPATPGLGAKGGCVCVCICWCQQLTGRRQAATKQQPRLHALPSPYVSPALPLSARPFLLMCPTGCQAGLLG